MSRGTEIEKADLLGERLVGGATEAARIILEELGKRYNVVLCYDETAPLFIIEVMVFYMHLVDCFAFVHLGVAKRETFAKRFVETVLKESLRDIANIEGFDFEKSLRDTYNRRQVQYTKYRSLVPKDDEPPKDTLCWEFSKILFGFLNDTNPVHFTVLHLLVLKITTAMVNDTLKVEEVLRS
jgi:hypothetical protein